MNPYSHLSNKRGAHAYRFWKIPPSTKKNPPSTFIDFITKVSNIIAEPNESRSFWAIELYSSSKIDGKRPVEKKATNEGRPLKSSIFELE